MVAASAVLHSVRRVAERVFPTLLDPHCGHFLLDIVQKLRYTFVELDTLNKCKETIQGRKSIEVVLCSNLPIIIGGPFIIF